MKPSTNFSAKLLLILSPLLFLSYHPVISLGANESTNFELSLPEIWLVIFALSLIPHAKQLFRAFSPKTFILASLFPLFCAISVVWSGNPLRTVLTTGLLWLIVIAIFGAIFHFRQNSKLFQQCIFSLLCSAVIFSIFGWLQCVLDLLNIPKSYTLLCDGCVSGVLGFPHPNSFAIEPQFFGNLLIAPTLLCFYRANLSKKYLPLSFFLAATLFLTLSRGAIYAFLIGLLALQILTKNKRFLASLATCVIAFAFTLSAQGVFSALSPTSDTFVSGVTKSVHQLSLGLIDLRPQNTQNTQPIQSDQNSQPLTSQFSGYIAESTDIRLNLNSLALQTWSSSLKNILIGTGLGSAGIAMHQIFPDQIGPKEIAQNEYLSLLTETGLVGCSILVVTLILLVFSAKEYFKASPLFSAVCLSFGLTLFFFSGLPNAIHLYLFPVFCLGLSKNDFSIKQKVQNHHH